MVGVALAMLAVLAAGSYGGTRNPPACFGAAARDATSPCDNPALRFSVRPTPDDAVVQPNSPCTLVMSKGPPNRVCSFGVAKSAARATVALLGDSHAPAWRAAVDVVARAQRWRGLTVRRSSCPFTRALRYADKASSDACFDWIRATLRWFGHHQEIHTVFVVTSAAYDFVPGADGDAHAAAVAGFRGALDALPPSIQRIVVLRDNPVAKDDTLGCVAGAMARHQRADLRCALARSDALRPDPAAEAATQLRSDRGRSIDLSRVFCDDVRCFPVVGGALVYKDKSHLNATFSATLGPLLLAEYRKLGLPEA
ncbi:MAG: hypothetical protein JWO02_1053 [Solirubrobacterales bacterium]|nr:hypothetical protein [Solirubrobacterales bacterium]